MRSARSILLAGLVAAVAAIAGCASGSPDTAGPGSGATAARQADAVCADLAHRRDAIQILAGGARRAQQSARAYVALAEVTVDRSTELSRIPVPSSGATELRRYLAAVRKDETVAWRVRGAVAQGDLGRAKELVQEVLASSASTRTLAQAAGLRVCGRRA